MAPNHIKTQTVHWSKAIDKNKKTDRQKIEGECILHIHNSLRHKDDISVKNCKKKTLQETGQMFYFSKKFSVLRMVVKF